MGYRRFLKGVARGAAFLTVFYAGLFVLLMLFERAVDVEMSARESGAREAMHMARQLVVAND